MNKYTHSQNFICKQNLIEDLVQKADFSENDLILDIGAGKGRITKELLKYSNHVIAIEPDMSLYNRLVENIPDKNLTVLNTEFIDYELPNDPFKVFANIPFNQTADIIKKLLSTESKLKEAYLILQKEAAEKFAGKQLGYKNTMLSTIYSVDYEFEIIFKFKRTDFEPMPNVDSALLKISRLQDPMITNVDSKYFSDFIAYVFNKSNPFVAKLNKLITKSHLPQIYKQVKIKPDSKPGEVTIEQYLSLFKYLKENSPKELSSTRGYMQKILNEQKRIEKIHRTRTTFGWTEFGH